MQPYCSVLKDLKNRRDVISINFIDQMQKSKMCPVEGSTLFCCEAISPAIFMRYLSKMDPIHSQSSKFR